MNDSRYGGNYPHAGWLSLMIGIPQLESDVLVVLDSYIEKLVGPDSIQNIQFLLDDDNDWARYLVLTAGYASPSAVPGRSSDRLMSL